MEKWLIYLGTALVAAFVGYILYTNVRRALDDASAGNIFAVLGMIGLLLILGATALQRARS